MRSGMISSLKSDRADLAARPRLTGTATLRQDARGSVGAGWRVALRASIAILGANRILRACGTLGIMGTLGLLAAPPALAVDASVLSAPVVPSTVAMTLQQVTPRVWMVVGQSGMISAENQGFNSNAGFVVTGDGVVVFDALGTPGLGRRLRELIASVTSEPIRHVVISHYHADHFYGLQGLLSGGETIWAQAHTREYLNSAAPADRLTERRQSLAPWVDAATRVIPPDRWVAESAEFSLGDQQFRLLASGPAHTPEDLMMLVEPAGVLFIGDLMFTGRVPFVGDADVASWIKAIDTVLVRRPRVVIGGHGPASSDAVADLAQTRDYLQYLRTQISEAFEAGLDFEEAYGRIDWSRFAKLPAFDVANRRNAYQTWLGVERDALNGTPRR